MADIERLKEVYNIDDLVFCQSYIIALEARIAELEARIKELEKLIPF